MSKEYQQVLSKAQKDLEAFLDAHPHMREYQREIDRVLDASTNRMEVIGIMLASKLSDLNCYLQELIYSLEELSHDIIVNKAA